MSEPQEEFQRKPQICLIDLDEDVRERLATKGLNIAVGTLGVRVLVPNKERNDYKECLPNPQFPPNLHEFDIVVLDLEEKGTIPYRIEEHCHKMHHESTIRHFACRYPSSLFNPRPIGATILSRILEGIFKHQGILIVFANERYSVEYYPQDTGYGIFGKEDKKPFSCDIYSFSDMMPQNFENKKGYEIKTHTTDDVFCHTLDKYLDGTSYRIIFQHPIVWDNQSHESIYDVNFFPILLNGRDEIVGFARIFGNNLLLVLPQFAQKGEILEELLTTVLPDVVPSLFPYNTESQWLENPAYLLPCAQELLSRKEAIKIEYVAKIKDFDEQIEENYNKYRWLHELLTESSEELVMTVKTFFEWLGFENIRDMDEINKSLKEEDLQIEMKSGLLVIEVKGLHGTSKDEECSQVNKFVTRRMKEKGMTNVQGLYIVNHQRHLPPLDRQNPPFSEIQIQDAINDERGLLTTWQLFNLYFSVENGAISKEEARKAILRVGLITFKPSDVIPLGQPKQILREGTVLTLDDIPKIVVGDMLLIKRGERYLSANIESIRVDDETVPEAENCGVGIKIDVPVKKKDEIFLKHP